MGSMVRNSTFSAYAGQITGVFGLVGSGRTEMMKVVSGVYKRGKMIFALSQSFWSIDMKSRGLKASPGLGSLFWKSAVKWVGTPTNYNR